MECPSSAGRVLAVGQVDMIGLLLMMAVLFWIPTHILTFSMRYHSDYQAAGVPTFPSTYGFEATRAVIACLGDYCRGMHRSGWSDDRHPGGCSAFDVCICPLGCCCYPLQPCSIPLKG